MFDLRRAGKLVRRFIIGKALLKISLPGIIWWEGMTVRPFAAGVQLNQLLGHLLGGGAHFLAGLGPLGPAQAAELDIFRIPRRGVAGKQVQLGDGNIQHIFFIVLNAQVVFGNALNRHSLDARIPANTVVLVHHQIARRDLGQAVQGILGFFTLFLLGAGFAKGTACQQSILGKRKFAPSGKVPRQNLHQPGSGGCCSIGGNQNAFIAQVACQTGCGTVGAGQQGNGITGIAQRFQILQQPGDFAIPGRQGVSRGVDDIFQRLIRHAAGKVLGTDGAVVSGFGPQVAWVRVQVIQPGAEDAVQDQGFQFLAPAVGGRAVGFPDGSRLFGHKDRVVKIIQHGGGMGVAHGQVFVHVDRHGTAIQQVQIGGHTVCHGGFLFTALLGQKGPKLLGGIGRLAEQNFPRGAQVKLINGILTALGGQVKGVQGIDLITPKFHTNRHFLVGSKNIHNIAAHRELAGAIHLGPAGVAGTKQSGQQVIPQQSIPRMEGAGVGAEILFWGGELGQGFRRHSHGAQPPAYQLAQHSQAAVLVFAGGALNGAQHIVPRREHGGGNAQRVQVGSKAGGFGLAGGHDA